MNKSQRYLMKEQPADERVGNFDEVTLGFDIETAKAEAARCLNCKNAPCMTGCPVSVRIPDFLKAVAEGKIDEAGKIIKTTNGLPSVCGRVCPQELQCESKCVRGKIDQPVSVGGVERFVGDYTLKGIKQKTQAAVKTGKKVAVIGSGPAGITCAARLIQSGIDVDIYESFHKAGGVLVYGIPEFRLPKEIVKAEIANVLDMGAKLITNCVVGKTITVEELKSLYDAVFIGSGAGLPMFMNIPGENLNGVLSANEYLTRINLMGAYKTDSTTPIPDGRKVCVIGAGNVAMDAARTAARAGAESVTIVYRRGREEMPARKEEVRHAEEEGIKFAFLTNPIEMRGENGKVTSLRCVKMELGEPDSSGRRRPIAVRDSEFDIETDLVIVALGTSPNPLITGSCPQLKTGQRGTIETDENLMTSIDGVYAGGDAVSGAATVILAMGAGSKAAESIKYRLLNEGKTE